MSEDESHGSKTDPKLFKLYFSTSTMIDLIKDHPCLWNKHVPEYRDKLARTRAWEEIYIQLEPAYDDMDSESKLKLGQQITKKWFNVRDAYLKSIKDKGNRRPYVYSNQISFLNPFLAADKNEETVFLEDEHLLDEEMDNTVTEATFEYVDENSKKRRKIEFENVHVKKEARETPEEFVDMNSIVGNEDDPEKAFFTSIVPVVKTLSVEAKLEFQIQVLRVLKAIRKKDKDGDEFD